MRKRLARNLGLKLASLVLAFVLWFLVVQINDPLDSVTFNNVEIDLINTDLLEQEESAAQTVEAAPEPVAERVVPAVEVQPEPIAPPVMKEPVEQPPVEEKRRSKKPTAEEVEQATAQVTAEIESSMAAEDPYTFPPVTLLDQNAQDNYIEAGAELNINPANSLVGGVSRFGKGVAVAGAFDHYAIQEDGTKFMIHHCAGFGFLGELKDLTARGIVAHTGKGRYTLTD